MKMVADPDVLARYNEDSLGIRGSFEGVFRPETEEEVKDLVKKCSSEGKSITAQGLRTSLTGASMCSQGYAVSLERMNQIIGIDVKRRRAIVEPGVVVSDLRKAVADYGLDYPPDPTSQAECTLGGNVSTNASGSRAIKYGSTIDWVRRLRVVDGEGKVVELESISAEKNCAGYGSFYSPARLVVGSEGTLGIITQVEVALKSLPTDSFLGMAFFSDLPSAFDFVIEARRSRRYSPSSMEFFDDACLEIIRPVAKGISVPGDGKVMIYFEQEYDDEKEKDQYLERWFKLIEKFSPFSSYTQVALNRAQKEHLLELRHHVPAKMNEESVAATKAGGCKISTDWAVPYHQVHQLFKYYDSVRDQLGDIMIARFGHIGEGHPHFNFVARDRDEKRKAEEIDMFMARKAVGLGGTIAGEHGIGKMKREHLPIQYPQSVIQTMKAVKKQWDPKGVLAPGNIFT